MNAQLSRRLVLKCFCYTACLLLLAAQAEGGEKATTSSLAVAAASMEVHQTFSIDGEYTGVASAINEKMTACSPFVIQYHETFVHHDKSEVEIQFLSEYYTPKLLVFVEEVGDASCQVEVFGVSERFQIVKAIETVRRGAYGENGCP